MRMSCNGCRVLRKGCSDDCTIRPCLEWIKNPDSQANATLFLAKFYGRAGLLNLIHAGPDHLRPDIFRSLLYESCGRIVNPIFGSVGLAWSGNWEMCENAVEAVLKGDPITQIATDIRHANKDSGGLNGVGDHRRVITRCRSKRPSAKLKRSRVCEEATRSPSHESSLVQMAEPVESDRVGVEPRLNSDVEIELDLSLGFEPVKKCAKPSRACEVVDDGGDWKMVLGLGYSAS